TATELQRHTGVVEFLNGIFAQDISMGALPTLRAATEETLKGAEYFGPNGFMEMRGFPIQVSSNQLSKDEAITKRLWEVSEQLTGVKFEFNQKAQSAGK
ncbi:MAG: short-chain dehydrogenase, partial [Actinomycetota bacterium]